MESLHFQGNMAWNHCTFNPNITPWHGITALSSQISWHGMESLHFQAKYHTMALNHASMTSTYSPSPAILKPWDATTRMCMARRMIMARWMIGNRDLQEFSDCTFFLFLLNLGWVEFWEPPPGKIVCVFYFAQFVSFHFDCEGWVEFWEPPREDCMFFLCLLNLVLFILIVWGELNFGNHPGKIVCFFYVCSICLFNLIVWGELNFWNHTQGRTSQSSSSPCVWSLGSCKEDWGDDIRTAPWPGMEECFGFVLGFLCVWVWVCLIILWIGCVMFVSFCLVSLLVWVQLRWWRHGGEAVQGSRYRGHVSCQTTFSAFMPGDGVTFQPQSQSHLDDPSLVLLIFVVWSGCFGFVSLFLKFCFFVALFNRLFVCVFVCWWCWCSRQYMGVQQGRSKEQLRWRGLCHWSLAFMEVCLTFAEGRF